MEKLIETIIGVEEQAQRIVADAKEREAHLKDQLDEKYSAMEEALQQKVQNRIQTIEAEEQKAQDEEIAHIVAKSDAARSRMEAQFETNKAKWTETFYQTILNS